MSQLTSAIVRGFDPFCTDLVATGRHTIQAKVNGYTGGEPYYVKDMQKLAEWCLENHYSLIGKFAPDLEGDYWSKMSERWGDWLPGMGEPAPNVTVSPGDDAFESMMAFSQGC